MWRALLVVACGCDAVFGLHDVEPDGQSGTGLSFAQLGTSSTLDASSGITARFAQDPANGSLIVVAMAYLDLAPSAVTDTGGNLYHDTGQTEVAALGAVQVFYASDINAGANFAVFVANNVQGTEPQMSVAIHEYRGNSAATFSQGTGSSGPVDDRADCATLSTIAGDVLFAAVTADTLDTPSFTAMSPFVPRAQVGTAMQPLATEDAIATSSNAVSASFGISTAAAWGCSYVSFH